jgi:hypothetical protein
MPDAGWKNRNFVHELLHLWSSLYQSSRVHSDVSSTVPLTNNNTINSVLKESSLTVSIDLVPVLVI